MAELKKGQGVRILRYIGKSSHCFINAVGVVQDGCKELCRVYVFEPSVPIPAGMPQFVDVPVEDLLPVPINIYVAEGRPFYRVSELVGYLRAKLKDRTHAISLLSRTTSFIKYAEIDANKNPVRIDYIRIIRRKP